MWVTYMFRCGDDVLAIMAKSFQEAKVILAKQTTNPSEWKSYHSCSENNVAWIYLNSK